MREAAYDLTLEASPVGPLVRDLVAKRGTWEGTASALLADLEPLAGENTVKQQSWPKNGRAFSNALRRLAPTLRAVGIAVECGDRSGKKGSRMLRLSVQGPQAPAGMAGQAREQGAV